VKAGITNSKRRSGVAKKSTVRGIISEGGSLAINGRRGLEKPVQYTSSNAKAESPGRDSGRVSKGQEGAEIKKLIRSSTGDEGVSRKRDPLLTSNGRKKIQETEDPIGVGEKQKLVESLIQAD